jgi:hypothetical protein
MKVKKSFIYESVDPGAMAIVAYVLAYFALNWWEKHSPSKINLKTGKKLPGKNVWNGINSLFDKKTFLKDFQKILYDEGNFAEFVKKVNIEDRIGTVKPAEVWIAVDAGEFNKNPITKRVVDKLIKTSDFKKVEKEYSFTKEDKIDAAKLFYWLISSSQLSVIARDIIFKQKPPSYLTKLGFGPVLQSIDLTSASDVAPG